MSGSRWHIKSISPPVAAFWEVELWLPQGKWPGHGAESPRCMLMSWKNEAPAKPAIRTRSRASLMCVLIIHCSDKYSCSQSEQPAVEVGAMMRSVTFWSWSSHSAAPSQMQTSQVPRMFHAGQDRCCRHNGVYFQRKEGHWSTRCPLLPSLSLSFQLYLSDPLSSLEQFLSIHSQLILLLCLLSVTGLFSLCSQCQACRWCYLREGTPWLIFLTADNKKIASYHNMILC